MTEKVTGTRSEGGGRVQQRVDEDEDQDEFTLQPPIAHVQDEEGKISVTAVAN